MSTLNEKIVDILYNELSADIYQSIDGKKEAANEIGKLILQEKINLLKTLQSDKFIYETVGVTISELTNQLNIL